jgi:hypothetical protein
LHAHGAGGGKALRELAGAEDVGQLALAVARPRPQGAGVLVGFESGESDAA